MRIESSTSLSPAVSRRAATAPSGDGRFAEALSGENAPSGANAAQTVATVDNLFVLQEVGDELTGRRRAVQRGAKLLDRLEDIRLALLTGSLPRGRLEALRQLAREQAEQVSDPQLATILDEIELRVAVELAKLDSLG
jgi:hypothetical protein